MYRHLFDEGIGLRQLLDYYFVLKASPAKERKYALETVGRFGMKKFAEAVMYVLQLVFGIEKEYLISEISYRHGYQLMKEIMIGGNFGKYDTRFCLHNKRGIYSVIRNMRFITFNSTEVLYSPFWKVCHWVFRKYLNRYNKLTK